MTADKQINLDNPLIWQGWRVDLPADWNPAKLVGTARKGTVIVADLERQRLQVDWRNIRRASAVNLDRLTLRRKQAPLDWHRLDVAGPGIVEARHAVGEAGETDAVLVTSKPARLMFVRIAPTAEGCPEPLAPRLLRSMGTAGGDDRLPWAVFGLTFSVPAGLPLTSYHFAVGRARLTFRRRRRAVSIRRWSLAADLDSVSDFARGEEHTRLGHPVTVRPASDRKAWDRWLRGPVWEASFTCPDIGRMFRLEASGSCARQDLLDLVDTIDCHPVRQAHTAPQRPGRGS
jgi:hypothetical protein